MSWRMMAGMLGCLACVAQDADPVSPEGTWLAADLHVHSSVGSNDTDGQGVPNVLAERMEAAGLDVVFVTDHSNAMGSMGCDDVEDCPNQGPETPPGPWPAGVFPASEISPRAVGLDPRGHVGCLPLAGELTTDRFIDRPMGDVSGADAVDQCHAANGFAIVNHPFGFGWLSYDFTSDAYDAMEVFNGTNRFDVFDVLAVEAWQQRVADGASVVPVGGSDCHRWFTPFPGGGADPALGYPTTHVFVAPSETILDGLRAGRVIVADPETSLSLTAETPESVALPGDSVAGPATLSATASTTAGDRVLQLIDVNGEVLAEVDVQGEVTVSAEVDEGAVYARVWPDSDVAEEAGVAIANVIRVRASTTTPD